MPRGRPFPKGPSANPNGRPLGARSKATLALENLLQKNMGPIGDVLVREAKSGAAWAVRVVIATQLPPARERPTPFVLPPIASPADLPAATKAILEAMAAGELTIGEGSGIIAALEGHGRMSVFVGHEERLAKLEELLARKEDG
jgi:hypothetical protein